MHVHVLSNLFPPHVEGGYELLARDVAALLQERGHKVTVVTSVSKEDSSQEPGVERVLQLARPFGTAAARDRVRHLRAAVVNNRAIRTVINKSGPPDAVLVMSLRRLGTEPLRVYKDAGVAQVYTVNDDWPVAFVPDVRSSLKRYLDMGPWARHTWHGVTPEHVIYLSDSIRSEVRKAGAPLPAGEVCFQGVPKGNFEKRIFRPISKAPKLLFVGRLHPTKAPDVAIETLAELRANGVPATLTLAGRPVSQEYDQTLRSLAQSLGVSDYITWAGFVDRTGLSKLYAQSDVFVFISKWDEPMGLTYLEAMSVGVPVVAYPRGGARELLDQNPGVAGRASDCTGVAMADSIVALLGDEGKQRDQVQRAHEMLKTSASLEHYVDVLEQTLIKASQQKH